MTEAPKTIVRRLPVGAEPAPDGGVHFRVWAPDAGTVAVELSSGASDGPRAVPLQPEAGGYFSGFLPEAAPGSRYRYRLAEGAYPDPASRFQPEGPHGASQVVDPAFAWTDREWTGLPAERLVIYELHLGTFTPEGTWRGAREQLPELARLGITLLEIMPVADFNGKFGWGYDGVNPFAPSRLYGTPEDARAFVDRAHALGLMVILDVVYNHLGPSGNFLERYAAAYFSRRHLCEWGQAINFDGEDAGPVRAYFVNNARHWIGEYHLDGLRLDATQQIFDESPVHILAEIADAAREAGRGRRIYLVGENEAQVGWLVRPRHAGGCGLDALWNDDFHHAARVAATGSREAYRSGYRGTPQELVSALKYGFLYQGQWFAWQRQRRGRPAFDLLARHFVVFLQNHDQVANSLRGLRLHELTSPGKYRALTALTLLAPSTPLLFQGQEFAASAPFVFFADHEPPLGHLVRSGRHVFLRQFPSIVAAADAGSCPPDPGLPETFARCKLDFSERAKHREVYRLHEELLHLRRDDPTLARPASFDGAVLGAAAFVLRYFSAAADDRLLLVNLGGDLCFAPSPEPLLAPAEGRGWRLAWSSEAVALGGGGTPPVETADGWFLPAESAVLLVPDDNPEVSDARPRAQN